MLISILIIVSVELLILIAIINKVASEKELDVVSKRTNDILSNVDIIPSILGLVDDMAPKVKSIALNVDHLRHTPASDNEQQVIEEFKHVADGIREQNDRLARGVNETTYDVLKLFINAVESNNANSLSDAVRSAKHMCKQYEAANR